MGLWNSLYGGFKNVLGKAVGAGKFVQNLRDKALDLVGKAKNIPIIGSVLDAGINAVMNTPVGNALRTANNVLNGAVDAGSMALKAMESKERDGGPPPLAQLKEIGSVALQKVKDSARGSSPAEPSQQDQRLDAMKNSD